MTSNLTALILLIISVAGMFFFVNPQYSRFSELRAENATRDVALGHALNVRKIRDELIARNRSFSELDLDNLSKLLPDSVDTVRLTMDLNGIASKYGIVIKKINISEDATATNNKSATLVGPNQKPYGTLGLSFSLTASYGNFVRFLDDLEQSLRIIDIISVGVNPIKPEAYDFTISARTYWLK